ncbi:MAG: DUF488 family protein [Actinomycetota bacterium]
MMSEIFTVGHSTRSLDELVDILRSAGVVVLIDVRRFPGSRRHPHFARESLEGSMPSAGISYEWWGEELGGRRSRLKADASRHPGWRVAAFQGYADYMDTREFRDALQKLESVSSDSGPATIMCAESLWWKCHRRLISDALVLRGNRVVHLMGGSKQQDHVVNPAARPDEEGFPIYDVGTTAPLDV